LPITSSDIKWYLSGGQDNDDPNQSLGGQISNTEIQDGQLNNLWDDVSGEEAENGDTEYRCIYVKNTHSSLTLKNAVVWISQETLSEDDEVDIGLDPAGVGDGINTGVATTIPNESTAPSGVTFSHPTSKASGLSIGDIPAGQCQAIWIRRTVNTGASAYNNNSYKLKIEGETAA